MYDSRETRVLLVRHPHFPMPFLNFVFSFKYFSFIFIVNAQRIIAPYSLIFYNTPETHSHLAALECSLLNFINPRSIDLNPLPICTRKRLFRYCLDLIIDYFAQFAIPHYRNTIE